MECEADSLFIYFRCQIIKIFAFKFEDELTERDLNSNQMYLFDHLVARPITYMVLLLTLISSCH